MCNAAFVGHILQLAAHTTKQAQLSSTADPNDVLCLRRATLYVNSQAICMSMFSLCWHTLFAPAVCALQDTAALRCTALRAAQLLMPALQNLPQLMNKPIYVKRCCQCQVLTYTDILTSCIEKTLCPYNEEAEPNLSPNLQLAKTHVQLQVPMSMKSLEV